MAWNRQKSIIAPSPKEPSLMGWLFAGVGALFVGALLFVLHANQLLGLLQNDNPWVIAAAPIVLWFSAFCLQGWLYNSALERHQFETHEADFAQQQWEVWAGRHHAVLHCVAIMPELLTSRTFLNAGPEVELHCHQALRLPLDAIQGLETLLSNAVQAVKRLPADLPLNVILLTDSSTDLSLLQKQLAQSWLTYMPEPRAQPTFTVLNQLSYLTLEERLARPEISAELILVQQRHGAEQWSDSLASLLLVTDDVASKYKLTHGARLLRPMALSQSGSADELKVFFSTQTVASSTQCIIGDSLKWGDSFFELLEASKEQGSNWKTEQTHWLENYAGLSGPFSPWLIAAVASEVVSMQKASCLMLSSTSEQKFINTVTTGNQDEHNG